MKLFLNKHKKIFLNILLLFAILLTISIITLLILNAFGIVFYDDGPKFNTELFDSFKVSWYGWVIILLFQVITTILLCFVPGVSMAFIMLIQALYKVPWTAFAISSLGVLLSSLFMYLVGRFGGYRVCKKILGEEDCEKASNLLNKGAIFFPFMMMFPMFPDDALVMIAGTLKMSMKWFVPSIIIGRGIGIAAIVFGFSSIPYDKFTTPWHWVLFIGGCAVCIAIVFYLAYIFNNYLHRKDEKGEKNN